VQAFARKAASTFSPGLAEDAATAQATLEDALVQHRLEVVGDECLMHRGRMLCQHGRYTDCSFMRGCMNVLDTDFPADTDHAAHTLICAQAAACADYVARRDKEAGAKKGSVQQQQQQQQGGSRGSAAAAAGKQRDLGEVEEGVRIRRPPSKLVK
jgi:hypothetical protein